MEKSNSFTSRHLEEVTVQIKSGNGGSGSVSFCREKFRPKGGPDGGDGGSGGNVYFIVSKKVVNLSHLRKDRLYKAESGSSGSSNLKTGKTGQDLHIPIPLGTEVFFIHPKTKKKIFYKDAVQSEDKYLVAKGGKGGKGNTWFKHATNQKPTYAQPGIRTKSKFFFLSLKLIADIGLVGFPNAGKSTLLKALTSATPKIGNYPFTTLSPNLGVIKTFFGEHITIADIPGILEGAYKGYGLGISFLKHIERVKFLIFVIDVNSSSIIKTEEILKNELQQYNEKLIDKPFLVVYNKMDLIQDSEFLQKYIASTKKDGDYLLVSAEKNIGIKELKEKLELLYTNGIKQSSE